MRRRLAIVAIAAAVALGAVVAALAAGGNDGAGGAAERRAAPPLPREVLVGPRVTLADLRGRPAVVNFWASWCGPCKREAPELNRLARAVRGRARLVGVDWTDGAAGARAFVRRYGWTFPVLRDADGGTGDAYRIAGLPTTFVLDRSGRIAATLRGPQTVAGVQRALARVD